MPVEASVVDGSVSAAVVTPADPLAPLAPTAPLAPADPLAPLPPVDAPVLTPAEPPALPLPDIVAPAAGFATRISGTTQAAAPAVATADIRPMARRREMRGRPTLPSGTADEEVTPSV